MKNNINSYTGKNPIDQRKKKMNTKTSIKLKKKKNRRSENNIIYSGPNVL